MNAILLPMAIEPSDIAITCVWKVMCDYQSYTSAEIVQRAKERGCRWSDSTMLQALKRLNCYKGYLTCKREKEEGKSVVRYSLQGGKGFPHKDPAKVLVP